jgi:hypothetical protein
LGVLTRIQLLLARLFHAGLRNGCGNRFWRER